MVLYEKINKRLMVILILLVAIIVFVSIKFTEASSLVEPQLNNEFIDTKGHWAEKVINKWYTNELIKGYKDRTFKPNDDISRAELIALINRIMAFKETVELDYKDVDKNHWYYEDIAKSKVARYISGYGDGTVRPNNPVTRQEVAVIISNVFKLSFDDNSKELLNEFSDKDVIATWSEESVLSTIANRYFKGYSDGTFRPNKSITRAEALVVLDRATGVLLDSSGTYQLGEVAGNVTVNTEGVVLTNTNISGNLYLTAGIEDGKIIINNVNVEGITIIAGGGEIELSGEFGVVNIINENANISFVDATIDQLNIGESGGNVKVNISRESSVGTININATATITGQGEVNIVNVNAINVSIEQKPKKVNIKEGITGTIIAGEEVNESYCENAELEEDSNNTPSDNTGGIPGGNTGNDNLASIIGINNINGFTVEVTFDKSLSSILESDFSFDGGLIVEDAKVSSQNNKVAVLTTSPQDVGKEYNLSYKGEALGMKIIGLPSLILNWDNPSGDVFIDDLSEISFTINISEELNLDKNVLYVIRWIKNGQYIEDGNIDMTSPNADIKFIGNGEYEIYNFDVIDNKKTININVTFKNVGNYSLEVFVRETEDIDS